MQYKYPYSLLWMPVCLGLSVYADHHDDEIEKTIIEERIESEGQGQVYFKDRSADQAPGEANMLLHIPGLTLTDSGGHLASSQIRYRGLSGARLAVDIEGLSLNNPLTGFTDANAMFLFAASHLEANGHSLSIRIPTIDSPQAKGIFGLGGERTLRIGGSAGAPLDKYSSIFMATSISSTDGNFSFSSPDLPAGERNRFLRQNNDQHRIQALAKYHKKTHLGSTRLFVAFNGHEGGIPGFPFSPTDGLRGKTEFLGLATGITKRIREAEFSVDVASSIFDLETVDRAHDQQRFLASTHEIVFSMKNLKLPPWIDFEWAQHIQVQRAHSLDKTRIGGGISMRRAVHFKGLLNPYLFSSFKMMGFHGHGLLIDNELGLTLEPSRAFGIMARYLRHERLPTFLESYSDNAFYVGNAELAKERTWDVELSASFRADKAYVQISGFFGYIDEAIVNLPYLATRVRPVNIKAINRYGLDLSVTIEPHDLISFETKNSFLRTRISATEAPMPHAPSFSGLSKIRIGSEDLIALIIRSRYRGQATANAYGTLISAPYALIDAVISAQLFDRIGISLAINNIFNIKTARDSYEMPLPGTMIFSQLEIGNI